MKKIIFILGVFFVLMGPRNAHASDSQEQKNISRDHIIKSLEDLNKGDVKGSVLNLEKSIDDNPNEAESYLLLSQILLKTKQTEEAASVLGYAAKLFPNNSTVFYMLGFAELEEGHKPKAILAAKRSIELLSEEQPEQIIEISKSKALKLYNLIVDSKS